MSPRPAKTKDELSAEIRALENLSHKALRARWEAVYGRPLPKFASRLLLLRAVAYRIQEEALGGLDAATRRQLAKIADDLTAGRKPRAPATTPRPGTRLIREWRGVVHEVVVREDGVEYRGKTWGSLSAVAREITGTRWSGPRFFGLRRGGRGGAGGHG